MDPDHDPNIPSSPPSAPAAACFGAGSKGYVLFNGEVLVDSHGPVQAVLIDVGSDAYFGLTVGTNRALTQAPGCSGVYQWTESDLQPNFQVDCSTNEIGSYWNGVRQRCYAYSYTPSITALFCGTDVGNIYSCIQNQGLYGEVELGTMTWATSV